MRLYFFDVNGGCHGPPGPSVSYSLAVAPRYSLGASKYLTAGPRLTLERQWVPLIKNCL